MAIPQPRFQECCSAALQSALALVSKCSGKETAEIEDMYRQRCADEGGTHWDFNIFDDIPQEELEVEDTSSGTVQPPAQGQGCFELLEQIRTEAAANLHQIDETTEDVDHEMASFPDRQELETILGVEDGGDERLEADENAAENADQEKERDPKRSRKEPLLPTNLAEAIWFKT